MRLMAALKWLARVFAVEYSVVLRCRGNHVRAYSSIACCPSSRRASATEGAVFFRPAYNSVSLSTAASWVRYPVSSRELGPVGLGVRPGPGGDCLRRQQDGGQGAYGRRRGDHPRAGMPG
ncbi:hypothetical protein FHX80_114889 [Streptomyces brevispora]|uniref:Uncharacterized protein n=1 Tax=Streptomyces brevispora TaxID=887462 RepID=A0A561V450_9ACTN|nr:hypothetical protein FHX80_114889 [Streptomyces brevispora]